MDVATSTTPSTRTTGKVIHWAWRYDLLMWLLSRGKESAFREKQIELAGITAGESVLDVGCGTGTLAIATKRHIGSTGVVKGIDASPEMIERARKKARKADVEIAFETAPIEVLPFPDASFDVVLSTLMLHHLPDDARHQGIREIRRVLKRGGRLVGFDFGGKGHQHGFIGRHPMMAHFDIRNLIPELKDAGFGGITSGEVGFRDLWFVNANVPAS